MSNPAVNKEKKKLRKDLDASQTNWTDRRETLEGQTRGNRESVIGNFPVEYFNKNPVEDTIKTYQELKQQGLYGGQNQLFGQAQMPEEIISYINEKRESEQLKKFEEWLNATFDMTNPLEVKYLQGLYPQFFEKRIAQLDKDADMMKRLARIRIQGGPSSVDDLYFTFAIQSGMIDVSQLKRSLWEPEKIDKTDALIERGLFNPKRWVNKGAQFKLANRADPLIGFGGGGGYEFAPGDPLLGAAGDKRMDTLTGRIKGFTGL